jgi:hypothetical protein
MLQILFLLVFWSSLGVLPTEAGIWIRPLSIKQGEVIVLSGLFYPFGNSYSMLGECTVDFDNKKFKFFREVLSYEDFRRSGGSEGFHYITRLSSTPLTPLGTKSINLQCPAGKESFQVTVTTGNFPIQNIQLSASKNSLSATPKETKVVNAALATASAYRLWDPSKAWLVPNTARRSSGYGLRRTYNGKLAANYFHKGLDFAAFTGATVIAPAKGRVVLAGYEKDGFAVHGNCLFIDHGQGVVSSYLHLSQIAVTEGQEVVAGQVIGKVGDTGIATGPHLHFGIYLNGQNVNPDPWLTFAIP